jgi:hypothetical protein
MAELERTTRRATYAARFEGGPWDGASRRVTVLRSGQPRDFLSIDGESDGAYALAGAARADKRLPYIWMPWSRVAMAEYLAARTVDSTDPRTRQRPAREPETR